MQTPTTPTMSDPKYQVPEEPLRMFTEWFEEAVTSGMNLPEAMALATADKQGIPSVRMVLLKDFSARGLAFYTNYESRKGRELEVNPRAALVFHWKELGRQVRVEGRVSRLDAETADAYFASRPAGSRLSAWASPQSREIPGREYLQEKTREFEEKFSDGTVSRPPFWGGFLLEPECIEFWKEQPDRLHDRIAFRREMGRWKKSILAP